MSLLIECWHKAKKSQHKGCQEIEESATEFAEPMKLDDKVFQFIEKNPGTTRTEIQNNFSEYNETRRLQRQVNKIYVE